MRDTHGRAFLECPFHGNNASGEEALSAVEERLSGTVVHLDRTKRLGLVGQPELALRDSVLARADPRACAFKAGRESSGDNVGLTSREDIGRHAELRRPAGGQKLRIHAARAQRGLASAERPEIESEDIGNALHDGRSRLGGIAVIDTGSSGDAHIEFRPHQIDQKARKSVIVAELELAD